MSIEKLSAGTQLDHPLMAQRALVVDPVAEKIRLHMKRGDFRQSVKTLLEGWRDLIDVEIPGGSVSEVHIADLDTLELRTLNTLEANGIEYLGELMPHIGPQLADIEQFGVVTRAEVAEALCVLLFQRCRLLEEVIVVSRAG